MTSAPGGDPHAEPAERLPVGSEPGLTTRSRVRHGLYWLADRPQVNADPVDLYVTCSGDPMQAAEEGIPTPHLFVIGRLHAPGPGTLRRDENLLRVRVDTGGAVDLTSIDVHVQSNMHLLDDGPGDSYLLPGGLLDRARLLNGWLAHPSGGYSAYERFPAGRPLTLRSSGARHGAEGLPGDMPRWLPDGAGIAYSLLPGPVLAGTGALPLLATRPRPRPGHRLLELEVPVQQILDVRAAAQQLAGMPGVRSSAAGLVKRGVELILPAGEQRTTRVRRVLAPGRIGWRPEPGSGGVSLADFLRADHR